MHRTTERFWNSYQLLSLKTKNIADKNFQLLKQNPNHPSLQLKKIGKFWSVRIGLNHRALAIEDNNSSYIWVWIGDHKEYERLLST